MVAIGRRDIALPIGKDDDLVYRFEVFFEQLQALVVQVDPVHGVSAERKINTETGLGGGGDLSSDRTLTTDWSNLSVTQSLSDENLLNVRRSDRQVAISVETLRTAILDGMEDTTLTHEEVQDIVADFVNATGANIIYDDDGNVFKVAVHVANTSSRGLVELSTNAETQAGTSTSHAVTPASLSSRTATETRTGLVELATDAEVAAGTDNTRAITPGRLNNLLTSEFAATLSQAGYQKLPGGLILQWGNFSATFDQTSYSVVFPLAFPNACFNVIASNHRETRQVGGITNFINSVTKGGCQIVANLYSAEYGTPADHIHWVAIGH